MKNALMIVDSPICVNIGDYIQAIAASQFYEKIDVYINREQLSSYMDEPVRMIMNGWYMHQTENWPPSNLIHPLFVAFHINSSAKEQMLSDESIAYLKKYEPIGCRDTYTMNLLQSKGISAYFSACLTLTLGLKYSWKGERDGTCYFVDPYIGEVRNVEWLFKSLLYVLCNYKKVSNQAQKMYGNNSGNIKNILKAAGFLWINSKLFSEELIENAAYIYHVDDDVKYLYPTTMDKISYAEQLIKQYARASLVITSRIHCALPCLGLNTPCLYLHMTRLGKISSCRLGGLIDFFTIIDCARNTLIPRFKINKKISLSDKFENNISVKYYIQNLVQICKQWLQASEK